MQIQSRMATQVVGTIPVRAHVQMAEVVGFVAVGLRAAQCLLLVVVGVGAPMEFEVEATTRAVAVGGVLLEAATRS